ncbi:MAG: SRPBCC family protein [Deltaproteobacteria bacterium]|nr:SRPBCC family protein [Deltaproteobacteria bacterium]
MRLLGCVLGCAVVLVAALPLSERPAHALSALEKARLAQGESVVEPTTYARHGGRYVGGVAYRIVDADAQHLSSIVRSPKRWRELLPKVTDVELGGIDAQGRGHVRLTHGVGPFSGSYSILIAFSEKGQHARFWVDRSQENDIADGWGFIRLTPLPLGKTLVTWGVLVDVGDGLFRTLFEGKIQRSALDFPRRLAHAAAH